MNIRVPARLEDVERQLLVMTLIYTSWNKPQTAQLLGLSLKAVYNWMHKYGLPMHGTPGMLMLPAIAKSLGSLSPDER